MAITKQLTLKTVTIGSIAGLIGGLCMLLFFSITGLIIGTEEDILSMVRGMYFGVNDRGEAFILGVGMHIVTSLIIGAIFGLIICKVAILRVTSYKKGITEGLIMAVVVFAIFYIPTTFLMVQPNLPKVVSLYENADGPTEITKTVQTSVSYLLGIGFIAHVVYGIVLGYTTALSKRFIVKD